MGVIANSFSMTNLKRSLPDKLVVNGISFRRDQAEKNTVTRTTAAKTTTRRAPNTTARKTTTGKAIDSKAAASKAPIKKKPAKKTRAKGAARKRRAHGATARASQTESTKEVSNEVNEPSERKEVVKEVEPVVDTEPTPEPDSNEQATPENASSSEVEEAVSRVEAASPTSENASTSGGLQLGPSLSINEVVELKTMLDEIPAEDVIVIGSSAVQKVDTAGIQLLLTFQLQAENFGQRVEWKNPSEVLTQAAANLGLTDQLSFCPPASNE